MSSIDLQCSICSASFRPGGLNEKGKCTECEKAYPSAKTKLEAMALTQPGLRLNEEITEEVVRQIAKEEIHKYMSAATETKTETKKKIKEEMSDIGKAMKAKGGKK